ncbi:hypothetical protein [Bacillus sp. V5-8f]|uniref:hypothetical protein n=1 Tax=Bacillus sp. V5-8f TaxID=2053044 RepID=UPI000C75C804|nr:hypothetical protein [Bacillus sp. V5-8f]PLT32848.1 hypothetical protein CUU64_17080 [Bacillus sp. V5-8f]
MVKGYWHSYNTNGHHKRVDSSTLEEVATKISRTYPFGEAIFSFENIDWIKTDEPMNRTEISLTHIAVCDFLPNNKTFLSNSITFTNG